MAEFIITHKLSKITTRNEDKSIEGVISKELIEAACQGYGAVKISPGSIVTEKKPYFSFNSH